MRARFLGARPRAAITAASDRKASFTEAEFGKTAATSGSRTTMLEAAVMRAAYGFRTARLQSYSGWISSALRDARGGRRLGALAEVFGILGALTRGGRTCADDADDVRASFGEEYGQETVGGRAAQEEEACFPVGVGWIGLKPAERITEDRASLVERDAMLATVGRILGAIPLEAQRHVFTSGRAAFIRLTNKVQLRSHIIKWCGPKGRAILTSGSVSCNRR